MDLPSDNRNIVLAAGTLDDVEGHGTPHSFCDRPVPNYLRLRVRVSVCAVAIAYKRVFARVVCVCICVCVCVCVCLCVRMC
jgi:hypothetical protein